MINKNVKKEMDAILERLNEILNASKNLKGDLKLKEATVKKLKKDLKMIRSMLDNPLDDEIAKELESQLGKIEKELEGYKVTFEWDDKETQTMPYTVPPTYHHTAPIITPTPVEIPMSQISSFSNTPKAAVATTFVKEKQSNTFTSKKISSKVTEAKVINEHVSVSSDTSEEVAAANIAKRSSQLNKLSTKRNEVLEQKKEFGTTKTFTQYGSEDESLITLLKEKTKINKFLLNLNYLKDNQW